MKESAYQNRLIKKLKMMFPGCIVLKNDAGYLQGAPDLLLLYRHFWAALEVKASAKAHIQPNQEYYIKYLDDMHFAAFVYPENEEDVLHDLQKAFGFEG